MRTMLFSNVLKQKLKKNNKHCKANMEIFFKNKLHKRISHPALTMSVIFMELFFYFRFTKQMIFLI